MPRLNLGKDSFDARLDETAQKIRVTIVTAETVRSVPRSETIRRSGMSAASFYKAWNDPGLFRVNQLVRIYDFLKVPEPERRFT